MKRCIVCGSKIKGLFQIENMPASAQNIPSREELGGERGISIRLCACQGCGLVQLDSPPVDYYKDVIRAGGYSTTMADLRRSQYREFIELAKLEGKKIVEAGCGRGEFLKMLLPFPVEAFGIEHKKDLVEIAKKEGLRVEEDFPEGPEHRLSHGPFDAFTSFNFLEHQPHPRAYLQCLYNNLTPEGWGLITVPSFEYIQEQNSFYEIIPDHIAYYTAESLTHVLQGAGFTVVKQEIVNRDTHAVIVKKRPLPDVSGILGRKEAIGAEVEALVKAGEREGKRTAIWGASHQGFTLCAVTGVGDKICYIIDSAPFKQGKFAPASHVPIVSPGEARENPADVIVIVAPGYTAEIAGLIRKDFPAGTEIYTLKTDRLEKL